MLEQNLFYIESLGALFRDVQLQKVFPDSKFFVDSVPKSLPATIVKRYEAEKHQPGFDIRQFVEDHFTLPAKAVSAYTSGNKPILEHLTTLWDELLRPPSNIHGSTLIPLPKAYVVPGGRFREIYYWDSYFTMLGLQVSKHIDIIENMIDNFAYLIDTFGFIPNGNRTYYLGRSQPPYFTMMVELLAEEKGDAMLTKYQRQLEKEYAFWMEGEETVAAGEAHRHVVKLKDGSILNRYWDTNDTPRAEAYIEDTELAHAAGGDAGVCYRNIRAAAASGWDFSTRWFRDGRTMETIETTHLLPVDLNCLLLHTEEVLHKMYSTAGDTVLTERFAKKITLRKKAINQYCWNNELGFFVDYNFVDETVGKWRTLAGTYPLFFSIADQQQADKVANTIEKLFLQAGGLTTTLTNTGQQWDAPNGWAPLQWMAYKGLKNFGHQKLAASIKERWMALNEKVYTATGKMMEKYNVTDTTTGAGGGEYPNQDGFGWTNGVYLKFSQE